jgi:hypothetical protein
MTAAASNSSTDSNPKFRNLPMNLTHGLWVVPGWIEGNLDKHEVNSPLPRGYAFRPIFSAARMVFSHSGRAIQL